MHLWEVDNDITRLLPITLQKSWLSRKSPTSERKQLLWPSPRRTKKKIQVSLTSVPGKAMEKTPSQSHF